MNTLKTLRNNGSQERIGLNGCFISKREVEVLKLISHGYNYKDIAKMLFISPHTATSHRKNLIRKLDAPNIAGLVRKGFELGLLVA